MLKKKHKYYETSSKKRVILVDQKIVEIISSGKINKYFLVLVSLLSHVYLRFMKLKPIKLIKKGVFVKLSTFK
jgi:hypothetical protein